MDLREKLARRRGRKDTGDPDTVDARYGSGFQIIKRYFFENNDIDPYGKYY